MECFEFGSFLLLYYYTYIQFSFLQLAKTLVEEMGSETGRCHRILKLRGHAVDTGNCIYYNCCSVAQSCLTLCDPMDFSLPGFPVLHHLLEIAQTHVHWVRRLHPTISSSVIPFSSCLQSFPASGSFPLSQVFASVELLLCKVLELQLQHQSFQWIFRTDFL